MKSCFLMMLMACMWIPVSAQAEDWLVTPEEAKKYAAIHADDIVYRGPTTIIPNCPKISLLKPGSKFVKAPFDIVVSFAANDGAKIDPSSFKVMYGFFKMDITNCVAQQALVSAEGVVISHANIPSGKHHLLLSVTDSMNRTGEAEIQIEVE